MRFCRQRTILQRYNNIIWAECHRHRVSGSRSTTLYGKEKNIFIKLHCCVKWYLGLRASCKYPSVGPRTCAKLFVFTFLTHLLKVFRRSDWSGGCANWSDLNVHYSRLNLITYSHECITDVGLIGWLLSTKWLNIWLFIIGCCEVCYLGRRDKEKKERESAAEIVSAMCKC